jgi:1,4-alpha-glucan branching enzyme
MIKKENLKNRNDIKLTFVLAADALPTEVNKPRVAVVGDFNEWNPTANLLVKRSNGTLSASVTLPAGQRVRFRYYASDGVWFNDQSADAYEVGEYGAENCVVLI